MPISTVLFDFDGTLADTLPICIQSIQEAFQKYDGRSLTPAEIVAMFGPTEADIIRKNLITADAASAAVEHFFDSYRTRHEALVKPNADISCLLDELKKRGIRIGVVTGKGRDTLDISLERLGMLAYFDVTISGDEVEKPKPDPEGVLKAMESLNAKQSETVFIGDSEADLKAGKAAGVFTIGAHWLENVQTHSFTTKPDLYVTKTSQLLSLLDTD